MLGISEWVGNLPLKVRRRLAWRRRADPRVRNHVGSNDLRAETRSFLVQDKSLESFRDRVRSRAAVERPQSEGYHGIGRIKAQWIINRRAVRGDTYRAVCVLILTNYFPFLSAWNRARACELPLNSPRETSSIILAARKIRRSVTEIQSRERGGSLLR